MPHLTKRDAAPSAERAPLWPTDSDERLSTLVAMSLAAAGASSRERPKVWLAPMQPNVLAAPRVWSSADDIASSCPIAIPSGIAAFALVPLSDSSLALCVGSNAPRQWIPADVEALGQVARTASIELRLRAELANQKVSVDKRGQHPLLDPVTELANRELFLDRVNQALMRCARNTERYMAVMSVAIDQFAGIESTFGYESAQEVLKEVASRLKLAVRNVDSVARLAGAEFGILIESLRDETDAARVAQRIHNALRNSIRTMWDDFVVTASIGVMRSTIGIDSPARMLQLAALARERAEESESPYELYDPDMQKRAQTRLQLEMELRRALESGQFELHYQPIVALEDNRIVELEALVRWRHPKRGLVSASDFIPLAEATGLVVPLGWAILDRACQQLREWRDAGDAAANLPVSINFTAAHLAHGELAKRIRDALEASKLPDHLLNIEVTEGLLIGDPVSARRAIDDVRELGVGVHIDDFGTGYSSLQYLHDLPLDAIKIDRRFIAEGGAKGKVDVAATIRELARHMEVPVIAEGVETPEHLNRVRALGCEFAQGYLFSHPLPAVEVSEVVARGLPLA